MIGRRISATLAFVLTAALPANAGTANTDPLWVELRHLGYLQCKNRVDAASTISTVEVLSVPNSYRAHCINSKTGIETSSDFTTYFDDWERIVAGESRSASTLDVHDDPRLPGNALHICQAINTQSQSADVVARDPNGVLFDLRCHLAVPSKSGQYDRLQIYVQSVRFIVGSR